MKEALDRMGREFLRNHPESAVPALEALNPEAAGAFLASVPPEQAGEVLMRVSPASALSMLSFMPVDRIGAIVEHLPVASGAAVLRPLSEEVRRQVLPTLKSDRAEALTRMLLFPEMTVGAVMDPLYPAFAADRECGEVIERLRAGSLKGINCLFGLNRALHPIGVARTHDAFLSGSKEKLSTILSPCACRVHGRTEWKTVAADPDLRLWNALPVVDDENRYIGAFREETLIGLSGHAVDQEESMGWRRTSLALGEVFRIGLSGILDTIEGEKK